MKTLNLCWYLGGHNSLEVPIEDYGSLEVAHIIFLCSFYYLIASSGIRAKVDCFLQQSPIHIINMSFWNEEERARLDKMRSEFLVYKEEASKRMEEIRKRIESFSPPCTSPASQSLPITPTSSAATVTKKRKKRAVEATKIRLHQRPTKPPSTSRKSAHLSLKFRRHRTQPSKCAIINSRRASMPQGVIHVHCGAREIKKRAFVWFWFYKKKTRTRNKKAKVILQLSCPIALFSYYNPSLKRSVEKFMFTIKDVGIQGLLVPDVPLEETGILRKEATRNGPSQAPGFLDDYAFLIKGLLDLFEFGGGIKWLLWATELQETQDELLLDREGGGYFSTPGEDPSTLLRVKEDHDGAELTGNSISAINLARLISLVAGSRSDCYRQNAEHLLAVFETRLKDMAMAVPLMCCAADMVTVPHREQVVLVDHKPSIEFENMLVAAHASYELVWSQNVNELVSTKGVNCAKPEFFLGDKEDVRGKG